MKNHTLMSQINIQELYNYEKIPPQAIEIESTLLGALLFDRDTHDLIDDIEEVIFYKNAHQTIFKAIKKLRVAKKPIDILTVTDELKTMGKLDEVGGAYYITALTSRIGSGFHVNEHYLIVLEKYIARKSILICSEMMKLAYSDCDIEEIEEKINEMKSFFEAKTQQSNIGVLVSVVGKESMLKAKKRAADRQAGTMPGINTGFGKLQGMLGGWQPGDLIFLAARPSMGKTAIAIHFAKAAANRGNKVLFFSLEMNALSITDRFVLGNTIINPEAWRNGSITNFELALYEEENKKIKNSKMIIYDRSSLRPSEVSAICKREKPDIIIIDYIQLMKVNRGEKFQNRNLEVGSISHELKVIAKEYHIPVIALSQLSRSLDSRGVKVPTLSDLRDSGELEQDADLVIFPYRPYVYSNSFIDYGVMELIVAKHRNGRIGAIGIKHNEYINNFFEEPEISTEAYS